MALFFDGADMAVNGALTITNVPFTVGAWVYPTVTGADQDFWCLQDQVASPDDYWILRARSVNLWSLVCRDSGAGDQRADAATVTVQANQWAFVIGRAITTTNRRISVLQWDGVIGHGSNTGSRDPSAGITGMTIGAQNSTTGTNFFTGALGEVWWTNTDIQADGAQLLDSTLLQLARFGPFSIPSVASSVVEYYSLLSAGPSVGGGRVPGEFYIKPTAFANAEWDNNTTALPTSAYKHPPLDPNYRKVADYTQVAEVISEVA